MDELDKFKNHKKIILFSIFLGILSLLIVTSFFGDFSLTGRIINNNNNNDPDENITLGGIKIEADLTIPVLELNGFYKKIELKGGSDSFIYIGNEKFKLGGSKNNLIIINDFDGKLSFNKNNVFKLGGKATKVTINGIPVEPASKSTLKVSLDEDFSYNLLKIEETVFIKELDYITSGLIKINNGKNIFNIGEEKIILSDFQGDLRIENRKFKINGYIEKLEILGDSGISVSS